MFSFNFRYQEAEMLKQTLGFICFSKITKSQMSENAYKSLCFFVRTVLAYCVLYCVRVLRTVLRTRTRHGKRAEEEEEENKWHAGLGSYRNGASSKLK